MPEEFYFGSASGSVAASILLGGFSVFLGIVVALLLGWRKRLRTPSRNETLSQHASLLVATAASGCGFAAVWNWLWSGFYVLQLGAQTLSLTYFVPPRQLVVAYVDLASVGWDTKPRLRQVLVVRTRDGKEYRSTETVINPQAAGTLLDALRARILQHPYARGLHWKHLQGAE